MKIIHMRKLLLAAVTIVGLGAFAIPAHAIIIGAPGDGANCAPFGCAGISSWGTEYQQVYASSDFSGPITIDNIRLYDTQFQGNGLLASGTYIISLSTTSKAVNGLDIVNLSANLGADNTVVFNGALPASVAFGGFVDIFVSPFSYDPSHGNLLMDVTSTDASGGATYFDAHNGDFGSISSRASDASGDDGYGLVTGFDEAQPPTVPEPAAFSLLCLGLATLGFVRPGKTIRCRFFPCPNIARTALRQRGRLMGVTVTPGHALAGNYGDSPIQLRNYGQLR